MEHAEAAAGPGRGIRGTGQFIISGLSGGHGIFHWFHQSFLAMLPEVEATFGLSKIGVGAISATRDVASGVVTLPGGILADVLRRHWGLVLACCMGAFGLGWLLIGLVPIYWFLLLGIAIVAMAASIWHLPAMASLSHHFAHRRGTALSFHGIGGNIGDALGPVVTGALLGVLSWQNILSIYAAVPLFLTFLVFWAFKDIGRVKGVEPVRVNWQEQVALTKHLLRNRVLLKITLAEALRGMAYLAFVTFLPIYFNSDVGMSKLARGLHLGLLVAVGIFSTPPLGLLSDRLGRKVIIVPSLVALCTLVLLLTAFGEGVPLIILIALLGIFLYSDAPILSAAVLDIVGHNVATTTLGVLSFARFALAAGSPLIAGALYETIGSHAVFYYVAGLFALSAAVLLPLPMSTPAHRHDKEHHGH